MRSPLLSYGFLLTIGTSLTSCAEAGIGADRDAIAVQIKLLADQNASTSTRRAAARFLLDSLTDITTARPSLIRSLDDKDGLVRIYVASILLTHSPSDAKQALKVIFQAINGDVEAERLEGAIALRRLGPHAKGAVAWLSEVLRHKEPSMRACAALALSKVGPDASLAERDLATALSDKDARVRVNAALALGCIGVNKDDSVSSLTKALSDEDSHVRGNAASALGNAGKRAKGSVHKLASLLKEEESWLRCNAAVALGSIGQDAAEAVPSLVICTSDNNQDVRLASVKALGMIGTEARNGVAAIRTMLSQASSLERNEAALALYRIDAGSRQVALLSLSDSVHDKRPNVRTDAISKLGSLGKEAASAVPELRKALKDPDEDVRRAAKEAIQMIAP